VVPAAHVRVGPRHAVEHDVGDVVEAASRMQRTVRRAFVHELHERVEIVDLAGARISLMENSI
jgi:hypothetical protein